MMPVTAFPPLANMGLLAISGLLANSGLLNTPETAARAYMQHMPSNMRPPIQKITDMKRTQGLVPASWAMVAGETASEAPTMEEPNTLETGAE